MLRVNLTRDEGDLRAKVDNEIRTQAERQRSNFISPGYGKAMAYQQKAIEADLYQSNNDIPIDQIPHVVNEAMALGISVQSMAFLILYLKGEWQAVSSVIERIERECLNRLEKATTNVEMRAVANIDWSPVSKAAQDYHKA